MIREVQKIEPREISLRDLVLKSNYLFRVSNYQRYYVWTQKAVRQFLSDGEFCWIQSQEENAFIHFAGQISLRTMESIGGCSTKVEIVDGQQRLTTFMLLIAVASQIIGEELHRENEADQLRSQYFVKKSDSEEAQERLILSKTDQPFWKKLTTSIKNKNLKAETESHKHLAAAADEIYHYLKTLLGQREEDAEIVLRQYIEAIGKQFRVVLLLTPHPGYAYALYQTINDRGIPLTPGELLKARTIELLSDKKEMAHEAEQIWDYILKDPGNVTNRYLEWNYVAFTGHKMEARTKMSIHEQYERDFFLCHNRRILSEAEQAALKRKLDILEQNVIRMRDLELGKLPDGVSNSARIWFELLVVSLKNKACIPLYLKVLDMQGTNKIKTLNNLTEMLIKAFFVTKTLGGSHDTVISKCYMEIWKQIDSVHADMEEIKALLQKMIKRGDCWRTFETKIRDDVYAKGASGNAKAKVLLLMLELYYLKKKEGGGNNYGDESININVSKLSIEHILNDSTDPYSVSREFYESIHKIGNLTLTGRGFNSRMKNDDFEIKRERYQVSPYFLTREVGKLEQWRREDFETRQKKFIEDLPCIFAL